jgi:hypothetical protein
MTTEHCQADPDAKFERRNRAGNPVKSVPHTLSGVRSILRSLPRRVDLWELDTPDLATIAALHQTIDDVLTDCVRRMRAQRDERGRPYVSWTDVGRELGITRQSAQERFGR